MAPSDAPMTGTSILRRRLMLGIVVGAAAPQASSALAQSAQAQSRAALELLVRETAKGAPIREGRVALELPVLADSGNAVPLKVTVQSPMTESDFVRAVHLISERNPVRNMATFHFGPHSGRAQVASRIRLAGTQRIVALAEMSDGSYWSGSADVVVTISACIDEI